MKKSFSECPALALRKHLTTGMLTALMAMASNGAKAQLSTNPDKFLGNITTSYQVDYGKEKYYTLWNQITCENESKWSSIEGSHNSFNWGGSDNAYNYAKSHGFPFKFHTLIWGSQYPGFMDNLSTSEQYKAIVEWMDAVKKHYPNLEMIDVVNEAVAGHAPAPYKNALGGDGKTGFDWIIKAFEMAHERWPNAILIYNDYNTFQWQRTQFIELVRTLRDAGAPIDAYGCQSHDLTDMNVTNFKAAMNEIQSALKMPMYSTEYDIGTSDDNLQEQRYKEQIPYMWEADYVAGITLWGYIYGKTWTTDGNSGIIKDGKDRPAMSWLRDYMASDKAKTSKSPFPGMKKEASVYIKPASIRVEKGEDVPVEVRAALRTKTIERVELYSKNTLVATLTEAPYTVTIPATALGRYDLKAIVYDTEGNKYERIGGFTAYNPRKVYKNLSIPGTIQGEDFDIGAESISYHDSDGNNQGTNSYRSNGGGVDIVTASSGYAIGYTQAGEWLEYTVNVKEAGIYSYDAYLSADAAGAAVRLAVVKDGVPTDITGNINCPNYGWESYRNVHGRTNIALEEGTNVIRVTWMKGACNLDRLTFKKVEVDNDMKISLNVTPSPATVSTASNISVTASSPTSTISNVKIYVNDVLLRTLTSSYETTYTPTAKGTVVISAIATDAEGKESKIASKSVVVNNKRTAYRTVTFPGTIEAENFDKGGEGLTFHDSDDKDEGKANYRTDNEGVDIVKTSSGNVLGYTATNEWVEYTVKVKEAGTYTYEATVSSGTTGSGFRISNVVDGKLTTLATVSVPQTASNSWDTYKVVKGRILKQLEEGEYRIRITITGANCNIDKINFICSVPAGIGEVEADVPAADDSKPVYNLRGQKVDSNYKGIIIRNGKKIIRR